jgi:hypothetical protein
MMREIYILLSLLLLILNNSWAQIDSSFQQEVENVQLEFVSFRNNEFCRSNNIELLSVDLIHCDSIKDKNILPARFHRRYLKSRLLEFQRRNDTLVVSFIGFSDCCAHFMNEIEFLQDSILDLKYQDIDEVECFCGACPYLFKYVIRDRDRKIMKVQKNKVGIDFSDKIYEKEIVDEERNFWTKEKTVKMYNENVMEINLLIKKKFDRKGNLIEQKTYYLGYEVLE